MSDLFAGDFSQLVNPVINLAVAPVFQMGLVKCISPYRPPARIFRKILCSLGSVSKLQQAKADIVAALNKTVITIAQMTAGA